MKTLSVQRYQLNCQVHDTLTLYGFSGAMLRGAFGYALREQCCVTQMKECKQCMLYRQCQYPAIFERPPVTSNLQKLNDPPPPYIIEPPLTVGKEIIPQGGFFRFNIILIGDQAIALFPLIIRAWERAFYKGLGADFVNISLDHILIEPQQINPQRLEKNTAGNWPIPDISTLPATPESNTLNQKVTIQLVTPLKIDKQKTLLKNNMRAQDFLMSLVTRYDLLHELYAEDYHSLNFKVLREQAAAIKGQPNFTPYDCARYSTRQKSRMVFRSVTGNMCLTGDLTPFLDILTLGQWLHVGSKTTFGLGQYQLNRM